MESEEILASQGSIPVKIVGGRLVAAVELSTIHRRIPANLFVDFDGPGGLSLHKDAAKPLKTQDEFGQSIPVSIHFPDFDIVVDRCEQGPESDYEKFTRLYSAEINENSLVGSIGADVLKNYQVTFQLSEGVILLKKAGNDQTPPDEAGEEDAPVEGEFTVGLTINDGLVWLPIQLADGKVHTMAISTRSYDSLIDRDWCAELGFPGGDVSTLKLGALNLADFVAFRPWELVESHPDQAIGVVGLNLLKHLHLTIDRSSRTATYRVVVPPNFPVADREYFKTLATEDNDQLEAWLEKYPKERLSAEAARSLINNRLAERATPAKIESAIRRLRVTWRDDMVSTEALDQMKALLKAGYPMQAVVAGELGIEGGRNDRYPNSVHQLHAKLGEILLEQDEDKRAWRHLLSAAFGVPDDGRVNLNLGRFYEKQKRYNRALSRYIQSVIKVETGEAALAGIARVQKKMGDAKPLSVDTIAPLIAGKTYNYAAATRYRPEPEKETNRVALVEFFTNAHYKKPGKEEGAIGGALGNEGVMTYYPRGKVAMLTYHLSHPELPLDSLTNGFAQNTGKFYGAPPALHLVNGTSDFPGQGRPEGAEEIFQVGRDLIRQSLKEKSSYQLELTGSVENGNITGNLQVSRLSTDAPAKTPPTVQIVLAERGVLYPSKSKIVIHHMVARAALTANDKGIPFEPEDGRMTIPFSQSLKDILQKNTAHLRKLEAAGTGKAQLFAAEMDPRQLTMVAYIRDSVSKEILQAIQLDPTLPDEGDIAQPTE
ncbi:MAG: hypothetical protein AB8D78_01810 [Akkermansiaceae bacterium]